MLDPAENLVVLERYDNRGDQLVNVFSGVISPQDILDRLTAISREDDTPGVAVMQVVEGHRTLFVREGEYAEFTPSDGTLHFHRLAYATDTQEFVFEV